MRELALDILADLPDAILCAVSLGMFIGMLAVLVALWSGS